MSRGMRALQERIAELEQLAATAVDSLHRIRARTSRVLAATSAFSKLDREARSLSELVRTLSRVDDASVDHAFFEGEVARLRSEMLELQLRFSAELVSAAEAKPPPTRPRPKPWWRFWS